jgi:hypothetical protein
MIPIIRTQNEFENKAGLAIDVLNQFARGRYSLILKPQDGFDPAVPVDGDEGGVAISIREFSRLSRHSSRFL